MVSAFRRIVQRHFGTSGASPALKRPSARRKFQPSLDALEDRLLLSTFTVTNLGDTGAGSGQQGDLRYCLNTANANSEGSNRIVFLPGLTGTITLAQGVLAVNKSLEIDGPGASRLTVSGNHQSGVFEITADPRAQDVRFSDLTIADGTGIFSSTFATLVGGGVYNDHAALTLTRCTITGNSTPDPLGEGGGIFNFAGAMVLDSCTISGNQAGAFGTGGGIQNDAGRQAVTLLHCTISGNTAGEGGAIYSNNVSVGGALTLLQSTVAQNIATAGSSIESLGVLAITDSTIDQNTGALGAIENILGTTTITDSAIANNSGGGLANGMSGSTAITGSTFANNASASNGGGIVSYGGDVNLTNCTISGNTAAFNGGGISLHHVRVPGTHKLHAHGELCRRRPV
jgi:predicted outer membrane repeat protein